MPMKPIRIGTRGSPLALAQTQEVITALDPTLKNRIQIVPVKTTGDTLVDRCLTDMGGKSLFTKEIEEALLEGRIDLAVHSMKDVTVYSPDGLIFPAILKREDARDAVITRGGLSLEALPPGSLFGTSSLRRQAHLLHHYPHLRVMPLRGNVETRLKKIETGEMAGTLLAVAGLKRLGILEKATYILEIDDCLPAIAQGAIGIQCRDGDKEMLALLSPLNHLPTFQAVTAERAFMRTLHGSCRTPMAAYGEIQGDMLIFKGMVCDSNGTNMRFVDHQGLAIQAAMIGEEAAKRLQESACGTSF